MSLFAQLTDRSRPEWEAFTGHDFVERLGAGTLPLAAFQDYLVQDYLFLVQFARANALAAFKARRLVDIRRSSDALAAILAETALHERLAASWGIPRADLEAAGEKMATLAYTRYVLDCGQQGDLLDLEVALAPCTIGYAQIGARLAPLFESRREHPYGEWIREYAGAAFQKSARDASEHLDVLAGEGLSAERLASLQDVFGTATRLETAFWQQALDGGDA